MLSSLHAHVACMGLDVRRPKVWDAQLSWWMAVARPLLRLDLLFGLFDSGGLERASVMNV
jgi:hypothetical protein